MARLETAHIDALTAQEKKLNADCLAAQIFTQENGYALQNDLAANDDRYNAFLMRHPATCIAVLDSSTGPGVHEKTVGSVIPRARGIAPSAYMSLLKEADDVLVELKACQRYADRVERVKRGR